MIFDEVDTETSSLKLVTTTSVKLGKFQPAAESDTYKCNIKVTLDIIL